MQSPLTKSQWVGACIIILIIALFIGSFRLANVMTRPQEEMTTTIDSLTISEIDILQERSKSTYYINMSSDTIAVNLHPFDPNTADSIELLQLGMKPWMARNMLRYRAKGGVWRSKESLRKVYGMTDELYAQIEPYIVIILPEDTISKRPEYIAQIKKDTILGLNSCDTTNLKYLRGIGSGYARLIVRYRQELGGYAYVEQLREIREIPEVTLDSIIPHFFVEQDSIRMIDVNKATVERMSRHPYLSFTQARAIYELRRSRFRLQSIEELFGTECLTDTDIVRLTPYLRFD